MIFRIDPLSSQPVFEQLAWQVKQAIARGELVAGDKLPSVRDIATEVRVNPNTVVRALDQLERDRVIVRRQGAGCFITPPSHELSNQARHEQLDGLLEKVVTEAFHLGFQPDAIRAALDAALLRIRFDDSKHSPRKGDT